VSKPSSERTHDDNDAPSPRKPPRSNEIPSNSYPKHVWSPAGGWYAQPANWRANTLVAGAVMLGIAAVTWKFSAERETFARKPEPGAWYPSRKYVTSPSFFSSLLWVW
jgi:hypothetical protein